jgi:hypothetical protein
MNLEEAIRKSKYIYEKNNGISVVFNYWTDNKKDSVDQRKKGFKTYFLRNKCNFYHQCYPSLSESKMVEYLGKRGIQPIKCWGCKGDHRYIDCHHRVDIMRNVHNIQEDTIVYVGRSVSMIYASLVN